MKRLSRLALFALAGVLLAVPAAWGQGLLVVINPPHPIPLPRPIPHPRPESPASYKIKELDYHAKVTDQVAQVSLTQSFVNTGSRQMEVAFVFPLPYDAAIDRLTFMVDGKEYDAKLLDAKEARQTYEDYVRRACDPALLQWIGWGMLKTSVFPVPPGAERKVTLRFSQLLRKDGKLTDLIIPLSTAKYTSSPVEKLKVQVAIETTRELKNVYSPTHQVNVQRPDEKHAIVKFEAKDTIPATDFRLFFDSADGKLLSSVVSYRPEKGDEGFFLLLASPEIKSHGDERPAKTVIFVVDRSGSMSGKKIEQAKEALKFVLNNLRQGDTFNIVAYDSSVESFRPELQKYDDETRKAALGFVEGLYAGGSTNIDGALKTALGMIRDDSRPNFVLFLTDGLPTVGERNEAKIVENAHQHNKHRARLIDFGVGYDVNSRLLDRLSRENFGQSEYVRPDEDIEAHVSRVYQKFAAPVMTDVAVEIEVDDKSGSRVTSRVYPKHVYDLFAGEQLVMVGRYKRAGEAKVTIMGRVGGKAKSFDFPAKLVEKSHDQSLAFVERLWAMRRIGEIIDEIDLNGKNDELVKELVGLSTKHGILTPYTSFLADENSTVRELADLSSQLRRAGSSLDKLSEAEGVSGFSQRAEKFNFQKAQVAPAASAPAFGGELQRQVAESGAGAAGFRGRALRARPAPNASASIVPALQAGGQGLAANAYREIDSDRLIIANGVQNAGRETLYKRGQTWIANNAKDIDPTKDQAKIQQVKRFSDDYFALIRANTADENAVLAAQQEGEELLVRFRGQAYLIK